VTSVLYVTTTFPTLAAFVESEVARLIGRGVRVRVCTLRDVGTEYQPEHAHLVPLTRAVGSPLAPAGWLALFRWFVRRPHVLVPEALRMLWASRGSAYALAGHVGYLPAAARVADLVEREDFARVHGAWAHFPASVAYLASRLTGRRFSMSAHAGADLYRTQAFLAHKARHADFTSACVRGNADMLRALAGPGARVEWIYHGVDRRRFDGAGRARSAEARLLVVGRLAAPKGFDDALRAVAELSRRGVAVALDVVGDGPERHALEAQARSAGIQERVTFHGSLDHGRILPLYRRAWALLAPCRVMGNGRRDGIPNVVVEAMAMGVPCVGTRAAGLEEAIVPDVNGALVDPGDWRAIADVLEPLLAEPRTLDAWGAHARADVAERFDAEHNFERLLALIDAGEPGAAAAGRRAAP